MHVEPSLQLWPVGGGAEGGGGWRPRDGGFAFEELVEDDEAYLLRLHRRRDDGHEVGEQACREQVARRTVLGVVRRVLRGEQPKVGMRRDGELPAGAAWLAGDSARAEPQVSAAEDILDHSEDGILRQVGLIEQQPQAVLDRLRERAQAEREGVVAGEPQLAHEVGDRRVGRHVEARQGRVGTVGTKGDGGGLATRRLPLEQHGLGVLGPVEQPACQRTHRVGHHEAGVGWHARGQVGPAGEILHPVAAVAEELRLAARPAMGVGGAVPAEAEHALGLEARVAPALALWAQQA